MLSPDARGAPNTKCQDLGYGFGRSEALLFFPECILLSSGVLCKLIPGTLNMLFIFNMPHVICLHDKLIWPSWVAY